MKAQHSHIFDLTTIHDTSNTARECFKNAQKICYRKNDVLIKCGEIPKRIYYIESGECCHKFIHIDGREKILEYMGKGSIIGDVYFVLGISLRSDIVCTQDTICFIYSREIVGKLLNENDKLARVLLFSLARKAFLSGTLLVGQSLDPASVRICALLAQHVRSNGQELVASPPWRLGEIERLMGAHRVTIYKAMKELEARGILEKINNREVLIKDEEQFFEIASSASYYMGPLSDGTFGSDQLSKEKR